MEPEGEPEEHFMEPEGKPERSVKSSSLLLGTSVYFPRNRVYKVLLYSCLLRLPSPVERAFGLALRLHKVLFPVTWDLRFSLPLVSARGSLNAL